MSEKIAAGFHTCVDYELIWDEKVLEQVIVDFDIHDAELDTSIEVKTERDAWVYCLAHLKAGMGGEIVPDAPEMVISMANRFKYNVTIGGTAARAVIAINKLGYTSALEMMSYNHHIKELFPKNIQTFVSVGEDHELIYPHVVLSYPGNVRIAAGDIDFATPRENRVMISRDEDSLQYVISADFADMIPDAEVFLLSCYSEILEADILKARLDTTNELLKRLPEKCIVVMEDGCYIKKDFAHMVHTELADQLDIISMNEDELQGYIGKRIDIVDVDAVSEAIEYVYEYCGVPTLIVHSANWALAYGKDALSLENALKGGTAMAATRFQHGDIFGNKEYNETMELPSWESNIQFAKDIKAKYGDKICCVPSKDMSFVKRPTVVGLGDFFVGGLLPGLLAENRQ